MKSASYPVKKGSESTPKVSTPRQAALFPTPREGHCPLCGAHLFLRDCHDQSKEQTE